MKFLIIKLRLGKNHVLKYIAVIKLTTGLHYYRLIYLNSHNSK